MVRVTVNGKRINWSLGKKVNPDHWITGAGLLKPSTKESKTVNGKYIKKNRQYHLDFYFIG